ncbi:hypothetical protein FB451DRAFT_1259498 [Mycena latifolia]|nr:hypothetical protein FB451DRAFT_1259498 [Mycena latifolia]
MDDNLLWPLRSTKYLLFEPTPCVPGGRSQCTQSADPCYRRHQMTVSTADRGITCRARGCTSKNGQCLRCLYEMPSLAHARIPGSACARYMRRCTRNRATSAYYTPRKLWRWCRWLRHGEPHSTAFATRTPEGPFYMPRVPLALHAMNSASLPAWLHVPACYALINGFFKKKHGGAAWRRQRTVLAEIVSAFTSDFSLHFFCATESVSCLSVVGFRSLC